MQVKFYFWDNVAEEGTTTIAVIKGPTGDTGNTGAKGQDGYTPVRGTDYWTNEDKQEIINYVLASIQDSEEVEY